LCGPPGTGPCPQCGNARFCSEACARAALGNAAGHSPAACRHALAELCCSTSSPSPSLALLFRTGAPLLSAWRTATRSALARLDFAGLGGDERNALRFLAQANALRAGAAAGDAEAAARWGALMGLAGGLPAAADASDLYGRLARAVAPLGGPSAAPRAQRAAGSKAD
jgi:hypothetical protein